MHHSMDSIKINGLKKYFGKTKAVDGISLTIQPGEIFGFLGPNGAGKTTTIRCIMDFLRPTEGTIDILGLDAQRDSVKLKKKIGYLSGTVRLYDKWSGKVHIQFIRSFHHDQDKADELVDRLNFDPSIETHHLSSGNRQKLGIIMAFMTNPEILILDEPTNALDPLLQTVVYDLLNESIKYGATVFMSSHNLSEVDRICTRVGIIRNGKMISVETIKNLKEKRVHIIHATFSDTFNIQEFLIPNIDLIKEYPDGFVVNVKGDLNTILQLMSRHHIKDLSIDHAPLEDIFLEYYENS